MAHAFSFRPLTEDDLPLMCEWLNRPHLQEWWREGDTSLEMVREKYLPRIAPAAPGNALPDGADAPGDTATPSTDAPPDTSPPSRITGDDVARPFLALLDGTPAGYIQYYDAAAGDPAWWPDQPEPGVLGIDQFLADPDRLGQGLGTAMISRFVSFLFEDPDVTEIRVDPNPANRRAIECYRKVGFREAGPITTPDGPARMMVLRRRNPPNSPNSQKTV